MLALPLEGAACFGVLQLLRLSLGHDSRRGISTEGIGVVPLSASICTCGPSIIILPFFLRISDRLGVLLTLLGFEDIILKNDCSGIQTCPSDIVVVVALS